MPRVLDPFRFVLIAVAGWMNQRQLEIIDYLREENRVLREQLGGLRVQLNDDQRRRLARMVKVLMRRGRNSSGGRRAVVGIEGSLRAAYRLRGIVGHYLCPGDCVRRGSAPGTQSALAALSPPQTGSVWKGIPA